MNMNDAYVSVIAALGGSAMGALGGVTTTWLNLRAQDFAYRLEHSVSRRRDLYGEFMEESARLFSDALTHELEDASKFVRLYSLVNKLRLFAPVDVLSAADEVMRSILAIYARPAKDLKALTTQADQQDLDILRRFADVCRKDLMF
jgi:hypothetical protein